jgi:hypothetical protein
MSGRIHFGAEQQVGNLFSLFERPVFPDKLCAPCIRSPEIMYRLLLIPDISREY